MDIVVASYKILPFSKENNYGDTLPIITFGIKSVASSSGQGGHDSTLSTVTMKNTVIHPMFFFSVKITVNHSYEKWFSIHGVRNMIEFTIIITAHSQL